MFHRSLVPNPALSKIAVDVIISTLLGYPGVWTGEREGGNVGLR